MNVDLDGHAITIAKEIVVDGWTPINLRDLRHCAATLIHAGGGDLHAIKETLRHSTIKLASDTYTSLLKEVDLEIAERAAALVPRARKPRDEAPAPGAVPVQGPGASQPSVADMDGSTVAGAADIRERAS